jgi:ADP-dependent NAD(P)H-hydrate dehydratase / NAD(P)H-hydrate epimerase
VSPPGVGALQHAAPQAIALPWPADTEHGDGKAWGHALALGPGLGRAPASREILERALRENAGIPMVLDADALSQAALGNDRDPASVIREWCNASEHVVLTPHIGEFSRLLRQETPVDWSERAEALVAFAIRARATTLLKGTPTLIATPDGAPPTVVARGNAALATGGSGDMLTGIIGALLAGGIGARQAAMLGATAHGIAAEIATETTGTIRGLTLEAVERALAHAWRRMAHPATFQKDILSELPTLVI